MVDLASQIKRRQELNRIYKFDLDELSNGTESSCEARIKKAQSPNKKPE